MVSEVRKPPPNPSIVATSQKRTFGQRSQTRPKLYRIWIEREYLPLSVSAKSQRQPAQWRSQPGGHKRGLRLAYSYSSVTHAYSRGPMAKPKLTKLELQIMEALWTRDHASIREIQETFPERDRPAYTTIQTTVYRLEGKKAARRVKKVGNFHIFEAAISRDAAQRRLVDDLLSLFGGRTQPVMAHLIESGKLTLRDVKEVQKTLQKLERKDKSR